MFVSLPTTVLVSCACIANGARVQRAGEMYVVDFLTELGHSEEQSQEVVAGLTDAYGDFMDMDEDDIRKTASQLLQIHAQNDALQASNFTFDHDSYHAGRSTAALTGSLLEKSTDGFVGPVPNVDCVMPYRQLRTVNLEVEACKRVCEADLDCLAFTHFINRRGDPFCETFSACKVGTGRLDLYVRNVDGVTTDHLPAKTYVGSHFYVLGDWGSESCFPQPRSSMHYLKNGPEFGSADWEIDDSAQKKIANVMGFTGRILKPFLVVNAGDNFYWGGVFHPSRGGKGVHDPLWDDAFEAVYKHPSISKVPWLSIMGNHDYGGNGCWADPAAQFDYMWKDKLANDRWQMPGPYYNHRAEVGGTSVEYFMLDTNIEDHMSGRSGGICEQKLCPKRKTPLPIKQEDCVKFFQTLWASQTEWLKKAMEHSRADWKIVVQHHKPVGAVGQTILDIVQPAGAHLIIGSHTHEMSFYEARSPPMLVVGAGGGAQSNPGCADGTFCSAKYGFASVEVKPDKLTVKIVHWDGKKGYQGSVCRNGKMC